MLQQFFMIFAVNMRLMSNCSVTFLVISNSAQWNASAFEDFDTHGFGKNIFFLFCLQTKRKGENKKNIELKNKKEYCWCGNF